MTNTSVPHNTPSILVLMESDGQYAVYDYIIGVTLCVCFIVGAPGNCFAIHHFSRKKLCVSSMLYLVASCIDMVSCTIHFPATISLFNGRKAGVLASSIACSAWYFVMRFVQQMSMFVVMVMSVCRTFAIVLPFYSIKKSTVLAALLVYLIYLGFWSVVLHLGSDPHFIISAVLCYFYNTPPTIFQVNYAICISLPQLITLSLIHI